MNKAPDTFGAIDNLKIQEALEVGRDEDQARERERERLKKIDSTISF